MLKFKLEQVAINPVDPVAAKELLIAIGATEWVKDHVTAHGRVFGEEGTNEADLRFNYDLFNQEKPGEFEILHYTEGDNWLNGPGRANTVSHFGMHCSADELKEWRKFFAGRSIKVAQEVFTKEHTNEVIAGKRWYNYVIFDTKGILGVDLKFIVRLEQEGGSTNES